MAIRRPRLGEQSFFSSRIKGSKGRKGIVSDVSPPSLSSLAGQKLTCPHAISHGGVVVIVKIFTALLVLPNTSRD